MSKTDHVAMLGATADFLSTLGIGDFYGVELPERMAWVILVLQELEDRPEWFPHGKWATIQSLGEQVQAAAQAVAREIEAGR